MNKRRFSAVHMVGIGGAGLSAIAKVLLERGYQVSGSDRQDSAVLADLEAAGARVFVGHNAGQIEGADLVVRSSAIPDDNSEVKAALRSGIPVLKRVDFLGSLMAGQIGIALSGTHGKSTTTGMAAWIFDALDQDPTFIIGGVLGGLDVNARAGKGPHFIIEADEYDRMFHGLKPQVAVITNIEYDHPDCYPTEADYYQAFNEFAQLLEPSGFLIVCTDDGGAARLARENQSQARLLTYGISSPEAQYRAVNLVPVEGRGYHFDVQIDGQLIQVALQVPGEHNVLNALAALLIAKCCDLELDAAANALGTFRGVGRRFEVLGQVEGVTVIDDYGHHPTEIRTTLAAARARYPDGRLWAVWQPHTYSRTRALAPAWITAFDEADRVVVTEIFASREQPPEGGYSVKQIVDSMRHPGITFLPNFEQASAYLTPRLQAGDVMIVFSAGDANQISRRVIQALQSGASPQNNAVQNAKEHCHV